MLFSTYDYEYLYTQLSLRNFTESMIQNSIQQCVDKKMIELKDDKKYILNTNFYEKMSEIEESDENKMCIFKLIELMKRDINDVYYSIMLECQKTKTFQMINQIFKILGIDLFSTGEVFVPHMWKKVFFLVSQNMQDLTSQNSTRILNDLGDYVQVFVFTSSSDDNDSSIIFNPTIKYAISYLLGYLMDYEDCQKVPFFIFLANRNQITKMNILLDIVQSQYEEYKVQSYIFFDEADQTYPISRPILLNHIFDQTIYENNHVIRSNVYVNKIYWISATQEQMVLEYPECAISKQAQIQFQSGVYENYHSILDSSSLIHTIPHDPETDHNDYLLQVVENNRHHFFNPLSDNTYRRMIGLASNDNIKQKSMAYALNQMGANVILLNQDGIYLYLKDIRLDVTNVTESNFSDLYDTNVIKIVDESIKCRNELIAKMYHISYPQLKESPLFILGNKKIDRGLTFHYAPVSSESYSFILTDLIMGRIPSWRRAVQAFGRGNGVIKHRADYTGHIDYWVDPETYENVVNHCKIMSDPLLINPPKDIDYSVSEIVQILYEKYNMIQSGKKEKSTHIKQMFVFTPYFSSFHEVVQYMIDHDEKYQNEKFQKRFVMNNGFYISTRLKKHFSLKKVEELNDSHICTKEVFDSIQWNSILYSSSMNYVIVPYYENKESTVQWIGVMKEKNNISEQIIQETNSIESTEIEVCDN